MSDEEDRARAIALLEANHVFPTDYSISVIAQNDEAVATLIVEAAFAEAGDEERTHERRPSSGGKYVSHRVTVRARDAEHVLLIYARLRAVEGVVTIL